MSIAENLARVRERLDRACQKAGRLPEEITLVAVAKGVGPEMISQAHSLGIRHFGENRVQEAQGKISGLKRLDITWRMVGHLQTNKAKLALELFQAIDSVDSLPLARALSRRAPAPLPILLEVNVSGEATKFGFLSEALPLALEEIARLPNLEVRGLMTVAPLVEDPQEVRPIFAKLRGLAQALGLKELSMGMSDDFEVAIEEGATQIRLGRAIFGQRPGML
jgi:pyridoxal phosphate enzyme (YggS family)